MHQKWQHWFWLVALAAGILFSTTLIKAHTVNAADEVTDHYLLVYFKSPSYTPNDQKVYFAVSDDGLHYQELNHGQPAIKSENVLRDPFIVRQADNQGFYILASSVGTKVFPTPYSMFVYHSSDLLNWTDQRVAVTDTDTTRIWAPEAVYDAAINGYKMYWTQPTDTKFIVQTANTNDFQTYSVPQTYVAGDTSRLDTTLIKNGDHYLRFTKNEATSQVYEERVADLTTSEGKAITSPLLNNLTGVEGPIAYQLYGQNKWILLLDHYNAGGYEPVMTTDIDHGNFQKLATDQYRLPADARHGSVLTITKSEYDRLINHYGID
ncbi:glycoside hydrolase family 43 protein [Agrilactobacillus yilanensis]|uniref:Glycoside hydrolase family 43 protein n=1 Tax=Agrilactobacillus yilanensis TaxID=2485997 RepID=A0ABW4J416_9LACO|nr:glycoside hydrolase family 43 protein [Agrilactobacillus yilanensis]